MSNPCFDYFPIIPHQQDGKSDIIENHDGNEMFVAKVLTIDLEEDQVKLHPNSPLTFGKGIGLAASTVIAVGLMLWAAYSQVQTQISEVRSEVSILRSDNREDFNRANDKLDKVTELLTDMRIDQAKRDNQSKN
ncbi:hypothetical protein [Yersinia enterocolitica]|uniref:hypothetical protein n=1 Tax=Yersinia enterocolitica TaxID=630 RepID=UPI003D7B48E1